MLYLWQEKSHNFDVEKNEKKSQLIYHGWLGLSFVEKNVFDLSETLKIYWVNALGLKLFFNNDHFPWLFLPVNAIPHTKVYWFGVIL